MRFRGNEDGGVKRRRTWEGNEGRKKAGESGRNESLGRKTEVTHGEDRDKSVEMETGDGQEIR